MKPLMKKELRLVLTPVQLLFLLLSGLIMIPNYPYFITFFYTGLGIFLMMQSARENRDVSFMSVLPVAKGDCVRARIRLIVLIELLQVLFCVPFVLVRTLLVHYQNAVGMEANAAFLGMGLIMLGIFNRVFFPLHYKTGYNLGKPFLVSTAATTLFMIAAEILTHIPGIWFSTVCERYEPEQQLRQLPLLAAGAAIYAALTARACARSVRLFERVDL